MNDKDKKWWSSCTGAIEIEMTLEQANSVSHSGTCDMDVLTLSNVPEIKEQLDKIDSETLVRVLDEYGAWDEEQLKDHDQNIQRLLWMAGGDISDEE